MLQLPYLSSELKCTGVQNLKGIFSEAMILAACVKGHGKQDLCALHIHNT